MNGHLRPDSGLGIAWGLLLATVPRRSIRAGQDLWRIRLVTDLRHSGEDLPTGPLIYAAVGAGRYRYVGQSVDLRGRLAAHASDRRNRHAADLKRDTWEGLLLLPLQPGSTAADLDRVEALAGSILQPDRHGGGAGRYPRR